MQASSPIHTLVSLLYDSAEASILQKAVFSKCHDKAVSRATLTLRSIKGKVMVQIETLRKANVAEVEGKGTPVQASHENLPLDDTVTERLTAMCAEFDQVNVMTTAGNMELRRAKSGRETLLGHVPVERALKGDISASKRLPISGNDKQKRRILTGDEPFLVHLGVSDAGGRVHDKKQPKFRQINRFLELIRDVEANLPKTGTLHICDLCCGKSYLSFAVYHYFTAVRGRDVRMVGVDMKADVIDECNGIARSLNMDGLSFACADVTTYEFGESKQQPEQEQVHMVISLHACDVATDIVIDKAIEWRVPVILSTPCCHHAMMRSLNCPTLDFIADHSMLKQKLCDAATDALRLKRMEAAGYDVTALELIDPEETPKNVMLRGIRRYDPASERCRRAREQYLAAEAFLLGT